MTTGQTKRIVELWNKGVRAGDIAKDVGVSRTTVYSYAESNRDKCPRRDNVHHMTPEDDAKAYEMRQNGMTFQEIADSFGIKWASCASRMIIRHEGVLRRAARR